MTTIADVCQYLETFAPLSLSEDWDNTGLLIGERSRSAKKVLTCLTITEPVVDEAVSKGVDMLVSHHPMLFRGTQRITDSNAEGRMLLKLIRNNIAVFSPHTSFDSCEEGINQRLAETLGLQDIKPLRKSEIEEHPGSGRRGVLGDSIPLPDFLETVRQAVQGSYLEYSSSGNGEVKKVGVACGSAAEFLSDAVRAGCDTFVTGEARFHSVLEAQAKGVNLILTGHYESERPAVEWLAEKLQSEIRGLEVSPSENDSNPLSLHTAS